MLFKFFLTLFLGGLLGWTLARGVIQIQLHPARFFGNSPPSLSAQSSLQPAASEVGYSYLRPEYTLQCADATFTLTIPVHRIQKLNLLNCPRGVLDVSAPGTQLAVGVGELLLAQSSADHPGFVSTSIHSTSVVPIWIAIASPSTQEYSVTIQVRPR